MTRINSAIRPVELTDQHLLAELRELPRVITAVDKRISSNKKFDDIPFLFTLGPGHVKFFYNKIKFLQNRYTELRNEYHNRYNKQYPIILLNIRNNVYNQLNLFNDYKPTNNERNMLINRINERLINSKQVPRYYSKQYDPCDLLLKI